jgi:hypothetical protein
VDVSGFFDRQGEIAELDSGDWSGHLLSGSL